MGDIIEIITWPKHQNVFYHVSGSGLSIDIKAPANAVVGLARKPGISCDYWIGIGDNNRSWIKKDDDHCKSTSTPDILSEEQWRGFCLQWSGGVIRLSKEGDTKPLVSYTNKVPDLKYITFSVLRENNAVHWKFILPPVKPKIELKPIAGGKLTWIEAGTQLPDEAIIGGYENEPLYIIRAAHRGSLTPGKFVPSEGVGYLSWGGSAHSKTDFEVLCGFDCTWVPTFEDRIPIGAVEGGYSETHQERLYVGRAVHEGHIIPGKVQPSHKVCYVSYKGSEIGKKKYEILVEPTNIRCVNKTFQSDMHIISASESDQDEDLWQGDDDDDDDEDEVYGYDSNDDMNQIMAL